MPAVLITGAASGIGRAAALQFAQQGWDCLLVDISPAIAALPAHCLAQGAASAQAFVLDLTDAQALAELGRQLAALPALDALVNNAGISDSSGRPLAEQAPAQWQRLLRLNLQAPPALFDTCLPRLKPDARIVNVSSGAGQKAIPWRGLYSPSKAGLIAWSLSLAQRYPELGVTTLCPGFVRTELVQGLMDAGRLALADAVAKIPLGRLAEPEEMAAALVFLAQPQAHVLSGQVLSVDGGSGIYGGSSRCALNPAVPAPLQTPLHLQLQAGRDAACDGAWLQALQADAPAHAAATGERCQGVVSTQALAPAGGDLLEALLSAGQQFAAAHARDASLVLLLPAGAPHGMPAWQHQTALAAARMLVATLACEWATQGLRINALLLSPEQATGAAVAQLLPLVRFLAGAQAQFVTGQSLDISGTKERHHG
ncbi:SDR family oxidoreductase [Comamonas sp.]|uniref:SDR family oxidoreductase n=1 Tax=Comamonas sp. TaxID=34028 RepID=UPI002898528C|nr:SDR family oxidoreductase [Comamonas sp.]